ncbi:MAG: hypothetical protein R3C30_13230 [Hyphomonadaceae bacterium]
MKRLLLVEDEAIIAFDLAEQLATAGFENVSIATSLAAGLAQCDACDVAVIDVNLGRGQTSEPIAAKLTTMGRPFVVVTGYGVDQLPDVFTTAPVLRKPLNFPLLVRELNRL